MLLSALGALLLLSSLALAVRARFDGRAETLLGACVLFNFLIVVPVYALGLPGYLYEWSLAVASVVCAGVALLAASRGVAARDLIRAVRGEIVSALRLPLDALRRAWSAGSLVVAALAVVFAFLLWTTVVAWLSAPRPLWDARWYHEPMIGFAIQNHGFQIIDVPTSQVGLQKANGYPRLCEMTELWVVLFSDRRLIELPNIFMTVPMMLAVYLLALRYSGDGVASMGWAAAAVTIPAYAGLIQSTHVDTHVAALLMCASYFSTRVVLRTRDAWFAAMAVAMAIASKTLSLVPGTVLGAIVVGRLLVAHFRRRQRGALAALVGGTALVVAFASSSYLRNWIHFHNPLWPDLKYDNAALHIHWPGYVETGGDHPERGGNRIYQPVPFFTLVGQMLGLPWAPLPGNVIPSDQIYEYGVGFAWVVLPLCAIGFVAALFVFVRRLIMRFRRSLESSASTDNAENLVLFSLPLAASLLMAPSLFYARLYLGPAAMMMVVVQWLAGRRGWARLGEGAAVTCAITGIMSMSWCPWWTSAKTVLALAKIPYPAREVSLVSSITTPVGIAREAELGPGTTVVVTDFIFPALLWNQHFSNRVVYLPVGPHLADRAESVAATWVVCYGSECDELKAPQSAWELVGKVMNEYDSFAYRRRGSTPTS